MIEIKSVLEKIVQQAWAEKDLIKSKQMVIDFINETRIKEEDKTKILQTIKEIVSKYKLDYYLANSLLTFEGKGLNQLR